MATKSERTPHAAKTLELLKRLSGATDGEIADAAGMTRPSVATKRTGSVSFTLDDAEGLAEAFGVPVTVFHMDHPEAREWIFANYGALRISGQNEYSVLIDLTDLGTSARVTAVAA
jgi:transcriptional regulator with XRE-family HTH domain